MLNYRSHSQLVLGEFQKRDKFRLLEIKGDRVIMTISFNFVSIDFNNSDMRLIES